MYQQINQKIWVAGVYKNSIFHPTKFKWQDRELKIKGITLSSDFKDGQVKKRYYSVTSGREVYRLEFDRDHETWYLKEVWVD